MPSAADEAMTTAVGKLPFMASSPTKDESTDPKPSCKKPSKADALPAFCEKGAREIAAAFG